MSIRDRVRKGRGELVVAGDAKHGYRLGCRDKAGTITLFGEPLPKQKDALAYGESKYGKTPKVTRKR